MTGVIGEAFVRVRPETKGFAGETKRGLASSLKSGAAVAGISLGLVGVIKEIKDASAAAKQAETIQLQAAAATKASGNAWETYAGQVDAAAQKQAKLQSFDDEEIVQAYTRIIRNVGDVGEALDLTALAGDFATARMVNGQRDLAGAALVVAKVAGGNVGILRRYGIQLKDGATASEALAALQQKVAGSAAAFASGVEGGQARLNKVFGDTQEIIGGALNPAIDQLTRRVADYLDDLNTSGETQRRVNELFDTGTSVVKGLAGGLEEVHDIAGPVVDALGGVEQVVKGIVIAVAVGKVVRFGIAIGTAARTFGLLASSSRRATAEVVADAAVAEAALDAAYRPRTVIVGTKVVPGTGGPILGPNGLPLPPSGKNVPTTKASRGTRLGRFVRKIPGVGGAVAGTIGLGEAAATALAAAGIAAATVALIDVVAVVSAKGDSATGGDEHRYPFVTALVAKVNNGEGLTREEIAAVKSLGNKTIANLTTGDLRALNAKLAAIARRNTVPHPFDGSVSKAIKDSAPKPPPTGPRKQPPKVNRRLTFKQVQGRISAFEEAQTDAQLKRSRDAERKALTNEEAFLTDQLKDTKRSADQRRQLKDQLLQVQGQIESIDADIQSDKESAATAAATRQKNADAAVSKAFDNRVSTRLGDLERQRREAVAKNDLIGAAKALTSEETFLKRLIAQTKAGSARRAQLENELVRVHERQAANTKKFQAAMAKTDKPRIAQIEKDLRGAGISAAAQITAKITGQDPATLGVFATGRPARGTTTSSGATGATGSVQTVSIDQLLRDLAVGQAQRDRRQLDETQETNRLLRVLVPNAPPLQPRRPGRGIDRLTGIDETRETATATGGLP